MDSRLIITYGVCAAAAGVVSLILTPLVVRVARAARLMDRPGTRRVHTTAVPRVGGVVLVIAVATVLTPLLLMVPRLAAQGAAGAASQPAVESVPPAGPMLVGGEIGSEFAKSWSKLLVLLACSGFIFLVGLVDDVRGLPARVKLLAQLAAATVVCLAGIQIGFVEIGGRAIQFKELTWLLTVVWIVGITNAVNLIDGLDGLAAGISAVTCAVIAVFAVFTWHIVTAVLMLTLLGALLGFLVFNFNPARIFLGDCGSMFLGFFVASASLIEQTKSYTLVGLALPVVALGVPIFDTLFTMIRRALDRRSLLAADRGHIHHRIIDVGIRHRSAVLLLYAVTAMAAGFGLVMMVLRDHVLAVVVFVGALVPLAVLFRVFGAMRLKETLGLMRRNQAMAREARDHQAGFETMQLRLREVDGFDQWWRVMRRAARALKVARMTVTLTGPHGQQHTLTWNHPRASAGDATICVDFPRCNGHEGWGMEARVQVLTGGSLESAGRRLTLLGRLLDEHAAPAPTGPVEQAGDDAR